MFIESGLARRFGEGDPAIVMGRSGIELALMVLEETVGIRRDVAIRHTMRGSKEYWIGWSLSYYQWETGLAFAEIERTVTMEVLEDLLLRPTMKWMCAASSTA